MAHRVRMAARAERDVDEALSRLQPRFPVAAARWHAGLLEAVQSLEEQPERYGLAPEAEELGIELRQLLFGKRRHAYRVLYTVTGETINVLHIRRASRRFLRRGEL